MKRDWEDDFGEGRRFAPDDVICKGDAKKVMEHAVARRAMNSAKIAEESQYVWHMGKREKINPTYRARAIATKQLREQLKTYSGSPEVASDMLFDLKKKCDDQGLDFTDACNASISGMKGFGIVGPEIEAKAAPDSEPKKPLASRISHWLWKRGLLPSFLHKNELSVDEADKT